MRTGRRDGAATRSRLLDAASEVFAEKGYARATVGEICRLARANPAAISYHFGGKDELYAQAWRRAFDEALRVYPVDGGLSPQAPADVRFRALISSLLHRMLDSGRLGHAGRLLVMEMTHPTEAIAAVRADAIRPLHEQSRELIRELLGPDATERQLAYCVMSVIHQCLAIGFRTSRYEAFHHYVEFATADLDGLADHVATFSLAGIARIRRRTSRVAEAG